MVKGGKMGAIPSGKGGECFPQLSPTQKAGFGGIRGVGRPAATTCCCSGQGGVRERKGGWGRRGRCKARILALSCQPAWRDKLVAPHAAARQRGPRQSQRGHPVGRRASVAPVVLARQYYPTVPLCGQAQ